MNEEEPPRKRMVRTPTRGDDNARATPAVFCLWGAHAKKKRALIDESRHVVVEGPHPSPLSAARPIGPTPAVVSAKIRSSESGVPF